MSLILVTNDDGVYAPGVQALFEAMAEIGRPVLVAPDRDNSASSHSLTMNRPLKVRQLGPDRYAVDGTPTDCVTIGIEKVLAERPVLLVSGINPGGNMGDDISYSGTVSAALEGTMLGVPAFAVSIPGEAPFNFATAANFARELAGEIIARGLPRDTLLNVNVPNCMADEISGVEYTRQGRRVYSDAIKDTFDPWGRKHYWIGGGTAAWDRGEDTDAMAVERLAVSVTPLHFDMTNYDALQGLRRDWRLKVPVNSR